MQAYFLSGVAGKYGLKIDDINALKDIFYGIYMEKTRNPTERIGLPGAHSSCHCASPQGNFALPCLALPSRETLRGNVACKLLRLRRGCAVQDQLSL